MTKIDRSLTNMHIINLASINNPTEIMHFFKKHKIKKYVYGFIYCGEVLKYGCGIKQSRETVFGERLYRQIQNIPNGWDTDYRSPSGKDFELVCKDFQTNTGIIINRKQMAVIVYDMTYYPSLVADHPEDDIRQLEAELIKDYKTIRGRAPIGNLREETCNLVPNRTPDHMMDKFFILT